MKNVTSNLNPVLALFLKVTVVVTLAIIVLKLAGFLFHTVLIAAILAAIGVGGFLLYNLIRRRTNFPVIR
jgi:hypothetical protein